MKRKQFIEAQGATCRNWTWSWSFVNEVDRVIIFGAWDDNTKENTSLILSKSWRINYRGKKPPGYEQSREHIRLIEEKGYQLKTFPIFCSDSNKNENRIGPVKIKRIIPELAIKSLKRVGNNWYAFDDEIGDLLPEEVESPKEYIEGASKTISVNIYERSSAARKKCIEYHAYKCAVCSFDFETFYGSIGKKYIHVHHKIPLSEIKKDYKLNPIKDLVPVCPNCHAIIHRVQPAFTVEQLKKHLEK
jgi:5-methylcytosine-specific restriction protein A